MGSPVGYLLKQNYPNPFNPKTIITYQIPVEGFVTLKLFDVLGNEVSTIINEKKLAGIYKVELDGSKLSSGIYFYKITSGNFVAVKKMSYLK